MIYTADGALAQRKTMEMPGGAVRWFIDGESLLRHVDDLGLVKARLVCATCEAWGGGADVRARPEVGKVYVACGHRPSGGHVKLGVELETQPLLLALGWTFRCSDCGGALEGNNDPKATVFTVTCPCTIREYRLPAA